ncbi:DUF6531 domain-containing protein [Vibrio metschnikovii]|uniref:DUF6531 domain-containing protein n=1 Tax=Vibrio metschnikovii TaxID=28172 RepID=UPI001C30F782|nr:interleukin-like EMT inducer domain-containing protein [Vibrio metschnikovii]
MAVVIGGAGLGNYDVLGQAGIKLSGTNGLNINASTGNLVIRGNDHSLVSRGLDLSLARTYNSQGTKSDFDGDNWRFSFEKHINAVGNNLQLTTGDGHVALFKLQEDGSYLSAAGSGAHDTIHKVGSNWVYTEGSTRITEAYRASDGRLLSTEDKHGNKITYRYNGNQLAAISGASGEELRFIYNDKGQLTRLDSFTIVEGKLTHTHSAIYYSYDAQGRLAQVKVDLTPADKSIIDGKVFTTTYTYQDANSHLLKTIQKSDGNRIYLAYQTVDGKARLSRIDDNGIVTELNYQSKRANGHQLQVTDNNGEVWYYKHDDKGRLVSTLNPKVDYKNSVVGLPRGDGQPQGLTTYQYDDQDNLIVVRDSTGMEIQNKYDANGNLTEVLRNGVIQLKYQYSGNLLIASHTFNKGQKEASVFYVYENGKVRFEISAKGTVTEHSYNGFGERASMRRYAGANYTAKAAPSLSAMATWAGQQNKQQSELTEYTYQRGELYTQTTYNRLDVNGRGDTISELKIVSWGFDYKSESVPARGVYIDGKHAGGGGRGVTITVVDANNKLVSAKSFDTYGNADASAQLTAHLKTLKASTKGLKVIVTTSDEWVNRLGADAKAALAAMGITKKTLDSAEIRSAFMAVVEAKDGNWVTTHEEYRPRYPASILNHKISNAEHVRTTYDAFGNLISTQTLTGNIKTGQVDVKSTTTQIYDGLNRVTSTTDGAGITTKTQYLDASRQVLVTTENGVTTRRTFSERGELISEIVSVTGEASRERTYIYNASGQLVATEHANGSLTSQFYDDTGLLWISVSASGQVTEYQRDSEGRVIREIQYESALSTQNWILSGKLTVSGNDVLGLIDAGAQHRVIRTEFDALGRVHRVIDGEQQVTEYVYDNLDRQVKVRHYKEGFGQSARELNSKYDKAGKLTEQVDADGFIKRFFYDEAGNLVETKLYKRDTQHVFQDADEIRLDKWEVYDSSPAGATMTPRYDAEYGGHVIDLKGTGQDNGYRLSDSSSYKSWEAKDALTISWDMKYSEGMTVYISLQTEKGHRYLQYHVGSRTPSIANGYANHGIGNVINGEWQAVTRDLEADLAAVEPDNKILHVNAFLIRGSGSIGQVSLTDEKPVQEHDRTQTFYDSRGRQQYVLDEQGNLTETRHLDGGREKVTYRYSKAVVSRDGGIESILRQAGTAKQLSRERFDAAGRLVSSTGMNSIETTYHYDSVTGLLRQQVTAANTNDSRSVYFDYNKFGELTGRVAGDGKQDWKAVNVSNLVDQRGTRSTYNVMGWKISDYHPATGRTEYQYDNAGRLIKTTDALGNTRSTRYTAFGQVKQSLVGGVVKAEYDYDRAGRVNREVDGESAVTTYIYNNQGQVQYQVRQHVNDAYQAFQSASGHLISRHVTQYQYDERGNIIERHTAQDYRAGTRISGGDTLTDVRSSTLRYQAQWTRKYDHQGRVASEVDGAGKEKIIDYLHGGRIKTVKLSGALQERIELDALGRTLNIASGSGETTRYEYDDIRNTVTVVSPGGIRTTTEKNAHGETISITDGLGNQRLFHYNHSGQVVRTEFRAADSSTSEVLSNKEYDANTGLLCFETNAEGTRTEIRYNAIGQQWKVIRDANGEKLQTEYGFDSQGQRIWEDTEGQRTYVRYDNNGQKVRVEQGGVATTYQYDVNGKVIRKVEGAVSGANVVREERVTEFNYDANGNLLDKRVKSGSDWSGTASSHITRYSYDGAGNVLEKASGVGGVTRYVYDNLGRVKYEINALRYVTEFQYDNANNLTKTVRYNTAIANQSQWTESSVKGAIRTSSADRTTELKYNNEGRIAYEIDGKGYATGYTYDANGQVIRTTAYGKKVSESGWNSDSTEKRVSESIYDAKGRLQFTINVQGGITERGYDKEGRITHTISYDTEFTLASRSSASINALKSHLSAEVAAGKVRAELSVYDELGRKRFTLDADGYLVEYQYSRQSLKTRKREYVDNTAVLTALNDVRSGNANMTEYRIFVALAHSLQTLEGASVDLKGQLAELNRQQSRITSLFGELTRLEKQISETNNANHDLGISIEHANSRLAGLQKEVEIELARHASLQKTINELAAQIKAHEDRLKGQNTQAVNEAKAVLDSAKAALNAANAAKATTAKKVRDQVGVSVLTTLHPEWAPDYNSTNGKIYKSVTTDVEANSALSFMSGHRSVLIKEKNTLYQQYETQLAKGENVLASKVKLDKTIVALEFIDKLATDIQADITARIRINNSKLGVTTAENAYKKVIEEQSKTNGVINDNSIVEVDKTITAIIRSTGVTESDIDIPVIPGSTTELLDKIDGLKSNIQVLTAEIDAQKSTVDIRAAELELRESEYTVARNAYNAAQAAHNAYTAAQAVRQAEVNAAKNAVNKAQSILSSALAEYNAAESSKKSHQDDQVAKQTAYNSAKTNYDNLLRAKNAAQTTVNNANKTLSSATSNTASKQTAYNTASDNYNYHHNEWVKANNHYKSTVSSRDSASRHQENTRIAYVNANNDYNAYNKMSWGTEERPTGKTQAGLNSRRATRDARLRDHQNAINSHNNWISQAKTAETNNANKSNTRVHYLNLMNTAKRDFDTANSLKATAQTNSNKANQALANASKAFEATKAPLTNVTNARDDANSALSTANLRFTNATNARKAAEAKFSEANSDYAAAKTMLDAMTSNVAGYTTTVKYEREAREAQQLAKKEHNTAVSRLNTLQIQRDAALVEQTKLVQTLTEKGSGSGTLVDASIDSIENAEALKSSAESSMISNKQKVEVLKGHLKTLTDSIETQRSELGRQQRIFGDKLNVYEASKTKVKALASKLALNEGSLYDADVQIMSWEEAKRSGAKTITASELKLSGQYLSKANAQNLLNSANSLLSSNKSVQSQRKADRDAAQTALQQAKKELAIAITAQTNAVNVVRSDNSWGDEIWLLDSDYRAQSATYQHMLNNKYRVLSEEQGGGSTGYTQAQINTALNARNAALGRLNDFKASVSNASSPIYTRDAQTALNSLNGQRGSIKLLSDLFYTRYKSALTDVHTNEEGNSSNKYTQSQINTFKAESDRAARAIQHLDSMQKKLTDNIKANKVRADLEAEVSRHTQIVVTRESLLVEATKKVDSAQADFKVATDSLNTANRALEAAKKDVADAHKAMDEVELHLNSARAHMDSVEDSIVTIRGHLDVAKTEESRALEAVVAARKELNVAQTSLNVAKGDLNNTVKYLNTAYAELQSATKLHSQASAYLDRAMVYKNRAGDTLSEAQQLVYLSTLSVSRDFNAGTASNDIDYLYDARGQLISERSATISYAEISVDGSVIQNIGRLETQHSYDSLGNVVATTTAVGTNMANTKRFVFNVMGDQTQSQGLAGSSVIYNDQNLATVNINAENGRRDRVYNQLGQLRFEIDEEGFVTEYRYNAFGQKLEQTRHSAPYTTARPNGKAVALADMESFVVNGGDNRTLRWTYDEAGQQIEVNQLSNQNALTIKDSVTFNAYGEKVATSRTYDGKTVITAQQLYNGDGQLVFSMDAEGYVTKFVYNNFGELARQVEYQKAYQEPGKPVKTWSVTALNTWIAGPETGYTREVSYTYDNRGNTRTTTRHGVVYHVMNASNAVVEKKQDITTTTYHDFAGRMYMSVQEEGAVNAANHNKAASRVLYEYDALGRLVSSWGKEREYVLTGLGIAVGAGDKPKRLVARQRTDYLYDAQGNQISTMTEGRSTFQYFNTEGKLTGRKDAEGNYTAIQTDAMNRIKSETQKVATAGALAYSYDKVTSYEYDKTGRQTSTSVNSSSGVIKEVAGYNAFGEVTSKRYVASGIDQIQETYQYDGFGRVKNATRKGVETTYKYNWMDKVTAETTGGTRVISREYDNLGNMVIERGVTFDGKKPRVEQDFDRYGNVLYRITNGARYDFKYNHVNQVIEQQAPEVDTVDNKGNVAKRRPVTKMYYDANGNRIAVQDANGNWQKSLYDTAGQKLTDINGVGGTTYYYSNAHGEMVGRINTMNQGEMFTYDNNGQLLTRSRLNLSQHYIEVYAKYAYDQAGQRYSEEWVGETGYTQWTKFDQAGRVMETLGGGQHRRYSYDSFGNKTREAWLEGGVEKASKGATFDGYGRQKTETWLDGTVITYTYNTKGELTRKHGGGMNMSFEYFDNGLLKKQTVGSKSETYVYDANGKQTQRTLVEGSQQLTTNTTWDSHGRLATISTTTPKGYDKTLDTSSVTYTYDAVGNRRKVVSKRGANAAETRWYRYDGDNRIHESHVGATDEGNVDNKVGSRRIRYNAVGQKSEEFNWISRSGASQAILEKSAFGYDVNGHLNSIRSYEYAGSTAYVTRHLTQTNSRTGHAIEQNEITTSYSYSSGLIQKDTGKTKTKRTDFVYDEGRLRTQDVYEGSNRTYGITFDYHFSGQMAKQQTNYVKEKFTETLSYTYQGKESFRKINIATTRNQTGWKAGSTDFKYNAAGHLYEVTSTKSDSARKVLSDFNGQVALQLAGGKLSAELAVGGNPVAQLSETKLNADLLSDSAATTGAQPGAYTVQQNDSLQRIAQIVYGDSRYWYLIADANGISPNDKLTAGKSLVIPNQHTQTYNGAESFKPYNESEVLGNVNPDPIAPPPPKKSCNPVAMIVMAVVAVVVTVYTAGAAAGVMGGVVGTTGTAATGTAVLGGAAIGGTAVAGGAVVGASVGAGMAAAAIGGAVGAAAAQLVGMAMGVVDEFSWESVALGGLAAGATAGLGNIGFGEAIAGANNTVGQSMANSAASYATNYVGSKALGQDVSFSWKNLAASVVGAGLSTKLNLHLGLDKAVPDSAKSLFGGTATGFAGAAASSAIRGESFGDNAGRMMTDAFGNSLANVARRGIREANSEEIIRMREEYLASLTNDPSFVQSSDDYSPLSELKHNLAERGLALKAASYSPEFVMGYSYEDIEGMAKMAEYEAINDEARRASNENMNSEDILEFYDRDDVKLRTKNMGEALEAISSILNIPNSNDSKEWEPYVLNGLSLKGYEKIREVFVMETMLDKFASWNQVKKPQATDMSLDNYHPKHIQDRASRISTRMDVVNTIIKVGNFTSHMMSDPNIKYGIEIYQNDAGHQGILIHHWTSKPSYQTIQPEQGNTQWLYPDMMKRKNVPWLLNNELPNK